MATQRVAHQRGPVKGNSTVYQIVTEKIIELLEKGVIPWLKPWKGDRNLVSGKDYRGSNVFILGAQDFKSPYWATLKQINELGGRVKKGEHGTIVTFWLWSKSEDEDTGKTKKWASPRFYRVFNVEQCEGIQAPPEAVNEHDTLEAAARIMADMPNAPRFDEAKAAYYTPGTDTVSLPPKSTFDTAENYYAVAFHEMTHSTGHTKRLGRPELGAGRFGSSVYAKEELVAEMGAAFLCGHAGFAEMTINQSASYIDSWLSTLRKDPKLVMLAAAQAQRAADYIMGRKDQWMESEPREGEVA
jgi:antirestriction protein ArdC